MILLHGFIIFFYPEIVYLSNLPHKSTYTAVDQKSVSNYYYEIAILI